MCQVCNIDLFWFGVPFTFLTWYKKQRCKLTERRFLFPPFPNTSIFLFSFLSPVTASGSISSSASSLSQVSSFHAAPSSSVVRTNNLGKYVWGCRRRLTFGFGLQLFYQRREGGRAAPLPVGHVELCPSFSHNAPFFLPRRLKRKQKLSSTHSYPVQTWLSMVLLVPFYYKHLAMRDINIPPDFRLFQFINLVMKLGISVYYHPYCDQFSSLFIFSSCIKLILPPYSSPCSHSLCLLFSSQLYLSSIFGFQRQFPKALICIWKRRILLFHTLSLAV